MLSPLSSPGASPGPSAESTTGDSESIHSLSQSSLSKTTQGMCTPTESPTFGSSNPATNGSDSNQTLTTIDPVSGSSTAAAGSGIPDTLPPMVTRNDESNKLKKKMDLDEPHQVGSSHAAKNANSNTKSKKRESGNDESHQTGASHSAKRPKKKAGLFDDDLDENNIIPDTDDLCGMKMTRAKKRSVEKKIETTNENVNGSHTAQSSNTKAIDAAASQNNTRITSGGQRKATNVKHLAALPLPQKGSTTRIGNKNTSTEKTTTEKVLSEDRLRMMEAMVLQSPTEAQERDYSAKFEPKPYNSRHLYTLTRVEKNNNTWSFQVTKEQKRRVPVGDAQYVWLQSQPKGVRDKAKKMDREGTSDPFGTFLEKTKRTLYDGTRVQDSVPVQYMSQFIKDRHTPIPADERKRKKMKQTYTFKTYFPTSALVQCCPSLKYDSTELNVEFIETVLETKSKESFELKAKIEKAVEIQGVKNAEAAEAARVAKAAEAVARGHPVASVASSLASSEEYIRVGLECEMILDDSLLKE
ncbi:uncharacterized protein Bfra_010393 [Botrytis fragariae]|uniref:Uncharacterized protein n=1 Tax=Botrytis fragariae TaxID=1964551 RepID=A0A8H6ED38_9HELO|nr:uncharacterized protein Bfra_010393 [Botrytis fragariae]KAF5867420.1 hypothetical protein Bfra_010393 [Botrytis fragariae]